jgi:hypothetical protein
VLGRTGNPAGVGGAADRMDQRVVGQDVVHGGHRDRTRRGVDPGHPAAHELDAGARQQIRDQVLGELLAGGDLVHPQPLGEPLPRVDQGHAHPAPDPLRRAEGREHAGVAGADNNYLLGLSHASRTRRQDGIVSSCDRRHRAVSFSGLLTRWISWARPSTRCKTASGGTGSA